MTKATTVEVVLIVDGGGRRRAAVCVEQIIGYAQGTNKGVPAEDGPTVLHMVGGSSFLVCGGWRYWRARCELIKLTGEDPDAEGSDMAAPVAAESKEYD